MGKAHRIKPGKWKNTKGPSCCPSQVSAVKIEVEECWLDGVVRPQPADHTDLFSHRPHDPHMILTSYTPSHPRLPLRVHSCTHHIYITSTPQTHDPVPVTPKGCYGTVSWST